MPIHYVCKPQEALVIEVWEGVVTHQQWRDHLLRSFADPLSPG